LGRNLQRGIEEVLKVILHLPAAALFTQREGRRIEDDGVEAFVAPFQPRQLFQDIAGLEAMAFLSQAVEFEVALARSSDCWDKSTLKVSAPANAAATVKLHV